MSQVPPKFGVIYMVLRALLRPWLKRVRVLSSDENLKDFAKGEHQVIFVSQVVSFIDFLIINEQLQDQGLPPMRHALGITPFLILPFSEAWKISRERMFKPWQDRRNMELTHFQNELREGHSGYLFIKRVPKWFNRDPFFYQGVFGRLANTIGKEEPITVLFPVSVFLTRMRKKGTKRTLFDVFFGTYDVPSRLRKFTQLMFGTRKGGTVYSKPINLNEERKAKGEMEEARIEKRLRWVLLFHFQKEDLAYRGPNKRSLSSKVRKILKEKRLNEELEKVAERQNRSMDSVMREAEKDLFNIASDTSERVLNSLRILFDWVWKRTIEGFDVRQEDLDMIRELNKKGPVVCLPCHRSHVDYLIFAWIFEVYGLSNPRFAAGDNLSKWPIGTVLRRAGGFFIRRSFKGEVIFPLIFEAYIRFVLRERNILVFFMEGGRSRSGKLLHPKIGMLGMLLDAWRQGVVEDIPLVPVTIDYGRIFEGQSYLRERHGGDKKKEGIGSLLRSGKLLKRKHGVIRLRFSEAISLNDYVTQAGFERDNIGFKSRIPLLHQLGFDVLRDINRKVTLTAGNLIAGLLLGNPKRGMTVEHLRRLYLITIRFLRERHVEFAFDDETFNEAFDNALATFEEWGAVVRVSVGGLTVVNIKEDSRHELDFYKNNGLHFILDVALFSMAFKSLPAHQHQVEKITERAQYIYDILSVEFIEGEDFVNKERMQVAFDELSTDDTLEIRDKRVVPGTFQKGLDLVDINAHLLLNFVESYFVVAETLSDMKPDEALDRKKFLKQCSAKAELLFAVGTLRQKDSINHLTFANALTRFNKKNWVKLETVKNQRHPNVVVAEKRREELNEAKMELFQIMSSLE